MLARAAGQAVAGDPLQELLQLDIAAGDLVEELSQRGHSPPGATAVILVMYWSGSCGSSLPVRRSTMPPGVLSSQGSASHMSTVGGVAPIGPRQPLDRGDLAGAGDLACVVGLVAGVGELARHRARQVERLQRLLELPAGAVPLQPGAPLVAVAQLAGVAAREFERQRVIAVLGRQIVFGDRLGAGKRGYRHPSTTRAMSLKSSPSGGRAMLTAGLRRAICGRQRVRP